MYANRALCGRLVAPHSACVSHRASALSQRAFTLVELLVVIGIIAVLIAVLMPTLGKARAAGLRTKCLSNIRQMQVAQCVYAANEKNALIYAGNGTEQGSWIGLLQKYSSNKLVQRCPADESPYFDSPLPGSTSSDPKYRHTSYAINNYVSPTHFFFDPAQPTRKEGPKKITQIPRSANIIQFGELAEVDPDERTRVAGADHLHVELFYDDVSPHTTIARINVQMPLGRHGGKPLAWDAILNFGFLDGHAESLRISEVYTDPVRNRFNPFIKP